jgi:hypothetical protein
MMTTPNPEPEARPRMTMRVYRVSPEGVVLREVRRVDVVIGDALASIMMSRFPPCQCPFHRDGGAGFGGRYPE